MKRSTIRVSVEKELKYISDYIDLQRFRLTDNVSVEFNVQGDVTVNMIAPLVLLPVIENAFKHDVSTEEPSLIKIAVKIEKHTLSLSVTNKKVRIRIEGNKSGKGIKNIRQRLDLIYPERHVLEIHDSECEFHVLLKILLQHDAMHSNR